MIIQRLLTVVIVAVLCIPFAAAEETGRIEGRVTVENGRGHPGVSVVIHESKEATITDSNGAFWFTGLKPGTYTLIFTHAKDTVTEEGVVVTAGSSTTVDLTATWDITYAESVTVYSASRRVERIVEAPAAVTIVSEEEIEQEAAHGQVPKLLEFTPGVEVTQSGLYDYNLNTRGFNSSLNRRVATLIDGRDPSVPFLGAQEWAAVSFPLDDLASVELVRGPSAALYGPNASSGVLNMVTKQPRYSRGGMLRLSGGEVSTTNADFRWAGEIGNDWYLKVVGGVRNSGDFTVSRNGAAEYSVPCTSTGQADCLPQEAAPLAILDDNEITFGGLRVDKYLSDGSALTLEGGWADIAGPVFQTGIGRVQLVDVERPWTRFNYNRDHWNVLAYYNKRDAPRQRALASGANLVLDTENLNLEVQTNWDFADERVRLVAGASHQEEDIDTFDPGTGMQSLTFAPIESDSQAVFAQADVRINEKLKVVVAARWDDSTLHDSEFSPKGSLVYGFKPNHNVRLTYNEAFQVANYSEFFLNAPVAPDADLSAFELLCLFNGVTDCGLGGGTPVRALGNDDLEVEEIKTIEVGYSGIIREKTFLTIDYYTSKNENFISDLLPNVGSPIGMRINPDFGPWVGSTAAETTTVAVIDFDSDGTPEFPGLAGVPVAEAIRLACAGSPTCGGLLSNNLDGSNMIAAVSYTNFGEVDTQGVDVGLNHYFENDLVLSFTYSWFDFDIKQSAPDLDQILLPNSPENKASIGLEYNGDKVDAGISARWTDNFRWTVGPFQGDVKSYTTVDLNANYRFNDSWSVGLNVANALDDEHWESFGGDILARRALGHVTFSW